MSVQKFDTIKKIVGLKCVTCKVVTDFSFGRIIFGGITNGIGACLRMPKCECGTKATIITGKGIGSPVGHILNCLFVWTECPDDKHTEAEEWRKKLVSIYEKTATKEELRQFEGEDFFWQLAPLKEKERVQLTEPGVDFKRTDREKVKKSTPGKTKVEIK